jgi:hypothetical protein
VTSSGLVSATSCGSGACQPPTLLSASARREAPSRGIARASASDSRNDSCHIETPSTKGMQ